uniref:Uncharacterized protein n=1 Tax=Glossina morsitans morsitans TaxID=37546 RepID=A0A1B0G7D9_GLOMM
MMCHVNGRTKRYHLDTVLLLSVFTGVFGFDRSALFKVSILGGFFVGQLDVTSSLKSCRGTFTAMVPVMFAILD